MAPLLPPAFERRRRHPGRLRVPDRTALASVLDVLSTGIAWREVPAETVGCSGVTAWRRLRGWTEAGVWPRLHAALLGELRRADLWDLDEAFLLLAQQMTGQSPGSQRKLSSLVNAFTPSGADGGEGCLRSDGERGFHPLPYSEDGLVRVRLEVGVALGGLDAFVAEEVLGLVERDSPLQAEPLPHRLQTAPSPTSPQGTSRAHIPGKRCEVTRTGEGRFCRSARIRAGSRRSEPRHSTPLSIARAQPNARCRFPPSPLDKLRSTTAVFH